MIDLFFSIWSLFGDLVGLLPLIVAGALFVMSLIKYVPWLISFPIACFAIYSGAYVSAYNDGVKSERAAWEQKVQEAEKAAQEAKDKAQDAIDRANKTFLDSSAIRRQLAEQGATVIVERITELSTPNPHDETETKIVKVECPAVESAKPQIIEKKVIVRQCPNFYRAPADANLLRGIQKSRGQN